MRKKHPKYKDILNGRKISEVLKHLPDSFSSQQVTIYELNQTLQGRAYGILLLILALPNLVPMPAPGLSAALGAPLMLFTFQHMLGFKVPWIPKFIGQRHIKHSDLARACNFIIPYLQKLEFAIKPRLILLVSYPADRFIALSCFILSLMIMLPVPFGNALPALAICLFAFGILQRDGLLVIFGISIGVLSAAVISFFFGPFYLFIVKILGLE